MKTFVWVIGKPGSGKTTIGEFLALSPDTKHFSYGSLLKEVQPCPSPMGYSETDRENANSLIIEASKKYPVIVVDGNPYSKIGFGFLEQMRSSFDNIHVVHLLIEDKEALARLERRSRKVLLHDGNSEADRVNKFNSELLPLIQEYKADYDVVEIDVTGITTEQVALIIASLFNK